MKLVLDDGTTLSGQPFGALCESAGEVVFNTGMTGYVETLTDPSYRGQILVLTYPLQGNYGVPEGPLESSKIQVQGLIVSHYSNEPNHHAMIRSLGDWLASEGVPGICGVDTRSLTRYLREHGAIPGVIEFEGDEESKALLNPHAPKVQPVDIRKVLDLVVGPEILRYDGGDAKILLIDTGAKENIVRSLVKRGATVIRAPWNQPWEQFLPEVDGVFLTNGPGDPLDAGSLIDRVRALLDKDLPLFGICFGHQLLSLAAGGKTQKMKYGHRGVNQPVKDVFTNKCYITSQNHGYVVQSESLPRHFKPWFVNLNDGSNEGMKHATKAISSVQFHPEATPGPHDTSFLFDEFLKQVAQARRGTRSSANIQRLSQAVLL